MFWRRPGCWRPDDSRAARCRSAATWLNQDDDGAFDPGPPAGTGTRHPRLTDRVKVHYTGWTTDGKMFDSSVVDGEPATFGVDRVIPGWSQGLQLMVEGEKRRFWIPESLAYKGQPGQPAGMLVFDVELLRIN